MRPETTLLVGFRRTSRCHIPWPPVHLCVPRNAQGSGGVARELPRELQVATSHHDTYAGPFAERRAAAVGPTAEHDRGDSFAAQPRRDHLGFDRVRTEELDRVVVR